MKRNDRDILAIDLKSFYASVECIDRGLDPFLTPLVVADESRGDGTIVLAASPYIKQKYGVKSRCRLFEVPKDIPDLIIARPSMQRYLDISAKINSIYMDFVSEEDLFVYSIDESFLDVSCYLKRNGDNPISYAKKIINTIRDKTGLTVTAGIGKNLFMAKAAMDIEAKHRPDFLASWDYSDIPVHLWPVSPLSKMWGIGSRLEKRLNNLGFYSVGDIALSDPEYLKRKLGVIGEEIYYHSLGYDDALLQERYVSNEHSLSAGQVLLRDYYPSEMPVVIRDMAIELSDRLYLCDSVANTFLMYIGYKDHTGYGLKATFFTPTDSGEKIGKELVAKFLQNHSEKDVYRQVCLVALNVTGRNAYQGSLFEDYEGDMKIRNLEKVLIGIRKKYGTLKAVPCSALTLSSTFIQRASQIGGHHA
ncbi:MAG: damage repair protein [Bacilli bacterium]